MIGQCIATHLDVLCMGVILGSVGVFLGQWLKNFLDLYLTVNQKKLDVKLGEALMRMRKDFE